MRVYFGTVNRCAPVRAGGELVSVDWSAKRVEAKTAIFPDNPSLDHDPNPRGNARGCRGIAISNGQILATTYHTVKLFDKSLNHIRDISHNLMVGLHEVAGNGNGKLWVTATTIDSALEFDIEKGEPIREFWPREMAGFQKELGVEPLEIDKRTDARAEFLDSKHVKHPSHLHLNAVAEWEGKVYALFHAAATIADLTEGKIVVRDPALKGGHNLLILDDGTMIANDSHGRTIRFYDVRTGNLIKIIDIIKFPWVRSLLRRLVWRNRLAMFRRKLGLYAPEIARPIFLRGLDVVGDRLFVGISPASILEIDWKNDRLIDVFQYSDDVYSCVHGLKVVHESTGAK